MSGWNDEYYDIIDFYYWEPQHLGKKKSESSQYHNLVKVHAHLRKIEVPLNHIFNIFFRLVPQNFIHNLIADYFKFTSTDKYVFHGNNEWRQYVPNDATQPDILLSGDNSNLAIELKVSAKSSLEQVVKYLLLHYLNTQANSTSKSYCLLYLSPFEFENIWPDGFKSSQELIRALKSYDFCELRNKKGNKEIDWDSVIESADSLNLQSMTYKEFYARLSIFRSSIDSSHVYSDVVYSLFTGLMNELEQRGYR